VRIKDFAWDERNINHIAKHGVDPEEAEEACEGTCVVRKGKGNVLHIYGQTEDGRYLFVVARRLEGGVLRVITVRDMTMREKRTYRQKVR